MGGGVALAAIALHCRIRRDRDGRLPVPAAPTAILRGDSTERAGAGVVVDNRDDPWGACGLPFPVGCWLVVASDLIPPSRRDVSRHRSPTVDQAKPGRPMDAPAHEITSPALSNQGAGPMKPAVGHVKWLVAALAIRRSHCQRYARPLHPTTKTWSDREPRPHQAKLVRRARRT